MKKVLKITSSLLLSLSLLTGCGETNTEQSDSPSGEIIVITREQGSGTRGAFVELTGVEKNKKDNTTEEAVVQNKTDGVLTSVAGDINSIGYISLGSLNDTVKALNIDGSTPDTKSIKSNEYKISRPFNIVFDEGNLTEIGKDFIEFIMSKEGQEIISKDYISIDDNAPSYEAKNLSGNLTISGSSSVTPVMERLVEKYSELNSKAKIAVQQSDSSAGIKAVIDGISEIGMASRELKKDELTKVEAKVIALDGIAIIVNKNNNLSDISLDNLRKIYTGEFVDWEDIK